MNIKELVENAYENAKRHGFWEDWFRIKQLEKIAMEVNKEMPDLLTEHKEDVNNALGNRLMLITGEVAEAHEALRRKDYENFKEELADIVIRTCDLAGGLDIDLEAEILKKMEKNKDRAYKHGKAF
ncbi:MazG-like family protein [Clostridium algidicarnis]|uniref:MazG-like family protein n=1 Tax=Clostridium algidicarnis TaxID=37659 RepID=UPI001C0E6B15|nr:nucleotide pyrophosphohydrolase [Clostridium algidicarnis]MBU3213323.1 nucleotide pyrophosphohydrolase [Clostridium algidicarnis]MBU3223782.1 nucleotide pyrophosphohydrolase [Clostridium algidicarnis]